MQLTADDFRKIKEVYRMTNEEMGAVLGISPQHVGRIINGRRNLTQRVANRVIERFDLTPDKLERIYAAYDEFSLLKGGTEHHRPS